MTDTSFIYGSTLRIHYRTVGYGLVPLILLHGFASSSLSWQGIIDCFPVNRYTLFLLDLKGFGLSDKPKDGAYSVETQAAIVRSFIREKGLTSVVLIGHSLGGAIALRVCLDTMDGAESFSVAKLVLIDTAAYPQRLPKFFRRLKSPFGQLLLRIMPVRMLTRSVVERVFFNPEVVTPELFQRYQGYFHGKGVISALRATVHAIDPAAYEHIGQRYRRLSIPALIIWGADDRIIKLKNGLRLHEDLAGSRLVVLESCGHNPHEERPLETAAAISEFLGY